MDDGRTTDGRRTDGRTTEHGYTISSPCEPDGTGELTKVPISFMVTAKMVWAFVFECADCWFSDAAAQ